MRWLAAGGGGSIACDGADQRGNARLKLPARQRPAGIEAVGEFRVCVRSGRCRSVSAGCVGRSVGVRIDVRPAEAPRASSAKFAGQSTRLEALAGRMQGAALARPGASSNRKIYMPETRFGFAVVFFQSAYLRAYWFQSSCVLESGSTRMAMQISEKSRKKSRCQLIMDICRLSARRMLVASLT